MKTKLNIVLVALVVVLLIGCKDDKPVDIKEVNTGILSSHIWNLQNLKVDNVDKTSLYPGMTLSFTTSTYSTTNGSPVWPANGTWSFSGSDGLGIIRNDDQVAITIDQISEAQLVLSLTWNKNTFGSGRVTSITGKHVYTFVK